MLVMITGDDNAGILVKLVLLDRMVSMYCRWFGYLLLSVFWVLESFFLRPRQLVHCPAFINKQQGERERERERESLHGVSSACYFFFCEISSACYNFLSKAVCWKDPTPTATTHARFLMNLDRVWYLN